MSSSKKLLRRPAAVLTVLPVVLSLTLSGFATPRLQESPSVQAGVQQQTGTLTATGPVTVNGNAATTGMTILTQSAIATGDDARASIEMGPLGRVDLEEETTVTLQMLGGTLEAALNNCGTITVSVPAGIIARVPVPGAWNLHVKVIQGGTVTVKYDGGKEQFVAPGNEQYFDDVTEITSNGGAIVFEVDCRRRRLAPFLFAAPLGLLALLFGGDEAVVPVLSPAIPG